MNTANHSQIIRTILFIIIIFSLSFPANAQYSGGTGEPNDPYQIATAEDLMLLGETPEHYDKHFILTADIDLDPNLPGRKVFDKAVIAPDTDTGTSESEYEGIPFTGVFDGNDRTISNMTITGESYLGLFGQLALGAEVSNLGLEAVDVNGTNIYIGSFVGENWEGSITTSYSTGKVGGSTDTGGLVGRNYFGSCITTSYSTATVIGNLRIGGLVGWNIGSVTASYNTGEVIGDLMVGGLAGHNSGNITSSYNTGTVTGDYNVAGLIGWNTGCVTTSYSSGKVSGRWHVGGLIARNDNPNCIISCFWDVETSEQPSSQGGTGLNTLQMQNLDTFLNAKWDFVDESFNGSCDYWQISPGDYPRLCYQDGCRPVMPFGLGTAGQPYLIRNELDLGTVWFEPSAHYRLETSLDLSGISWTMAIVPWFGGNFNGNGFIISNLKIKGGEFLGPFGTLGYGAEISNLGVEAAAINGAGDYVGDLAGLIWHGSIATSYITGVITGYESVGGLVGLNWLGGSISNSYSSSEVHGTKAVGGFVGAILDGSITSSYSTGIVKGQEDVGGFVGYNYGDINTSFWDKQTSRRGTSAGGIGKTTSQMRTASTFINSGWDFVGETTNGTEDIWWMPKNDYPRLWWETE
jgi:hypothetical protein